MKRFSLKSESTKGKNNISHISIIKWHIRHPMSSSTLYLICIRDCLSQNDCLS